MINFVTLDYPSLITPIRNVTQTSLKFVSIETESWRKNMLFHKRLLYSKQINFHTIFFLYITNSRCLVKCICDIAMHISVKITGYLVSDAWFLVTRQFELFQKYCVKYSGLFDSTANLINVYSDMAFTCKVHQIKCSCVCYVLRHT